MLTPTQPNGVYYKVLQLLHPFKRMELAKLYYTVKKVWSKKGDHSVKRVKSYSKCSKLLLEVVSFHSIPSKILLFLQSDPLFYSI